MERKLTINPVKPGRRDRAFWPTAFILLPTPISIAFGAFLIEIFF